MYSVTEFRHINPSSSQFSEFSLFSILHQTFPSLAWNVSLSLVSCSLFARPINLVVVSARISKFRCQLHTYALVDLRSLVVNGCRFCCAFLDWIKFKCEFVVTIALEMFQIIIDSRRVCVCLSSGSNVCQSRMVWQCVQPCIPMRQLHASHT